MSTRQLRKLQKQRELEQLKLQSVTPETQEPSEDEEHEPIASKPRASLFAALGGVDEDDEQQSENEENEENDNKAAAAEDSEKEAVPRPVKKNKSKKKKKNKGKKKDTSAGDDTPQNPSSKGNEDDEIEAALRELDLARESAHKGTSTALTTSTDRYGTSLLQINPNHLKAMNEMQSLFGKDVIEAARQEEQAERAAELQRQRGGHGPRQVNLEQALRGDPRYKLSEVLLRRNPFIRGMDHWPRATPQDLSMQEVRGGEDGLTEFTFHHAFEYDKTQVAFIRMVMAGDPMMLVNLLLTHPYHITTLLQVSKIATQDQNPALAAELCERALFAFGRVTTPAFRHKMEQGKARLDFRRPENREFWLAGYHYLKSLMRKGTFRTALEWARLLFALNPNDPYGMKNFLHPLAIRAREAQWLVDFCDAEEFDTGMSDDLYIRQTLVLAKLQLSDQSQGQEDKDRRRAEARELAVQGMRRLPWLYTALLGALNLDVPPPLWGIRPKGPQRYWTEMYLHQAKELWDNAQAIGLLKEVAALLGTAKVDAWALPQDQPSDLRTARLAFLEGNTKIITEIPSHMLAQQPNYEFDPLPPPYAENIFSSDGVRLPWDAPVYSASQHPHTQHEHHRQQVAGAAAAEPLPRDAVDGQGWPIFGDAEEEEEDNGRNAAGDAGGTADDDDAVPGQEGTAIRRLMADFLGPLFGRATAATGDGGGDGPGQGSAREADEGRRAGVMPGAYETDEEDDGGTGGRENARQRQA
ncbi:hypothetical protein SODALDRAFT_335509 [Sodiomyces alkalinus F11]|uniref:DUF654-domain-containing protein n=1 Tax=Sodiomyces alkalinus (strain CBS 110278 / VKM F-3762 / F11) TaxID=1314773 RepID=A0A3N2PPH4_SODAK|nr:hypothetical protein SODALDRAFT_335509 [Sodiomyces alkalinus F11]ROT36412.1 hypothetical protein SODALDRAFT_335509 [Sodiomyces alkalinus F11]